MTKEVEEQLTDTVEKGIKKAALTLSTIIGETFSDGYIAGWNECLTMMENKLHIQPFDYGNVTIIGKDFAPKEDIK